MKNWKKWLTTGILAIALGTAGISGVKDVKAESVNPALLRQNVAEGEEVPQVGATSSASVDKRAWRRINGVCYNGSGAEIPGVVTRGIDVSEWQGKINWQKVKNSDIDFAFIRISSGTDYMDKYYDYNMSSANAADLPVGTYVYSKATTTTAALKEAQLAINKMNGYKVSYPVVYDIEYSKMSSLSKNQIAKMALAFCNEVKAAGYTPMVYLNTNWYKEKVNMSLLSGIDVWIASYSDKNPAPDRSVYSYGIWQCTAGNLGEGSYMRTTKGLVAGIPTENNVDLNYGFVDYTTRVTPRWSAREGYTPATKASTSNISVKNGWYTENGRKCYYINDERVKGWKQIGGKYYYFHPVSGNMYVNSLVKVNGVIYYVDKNGVRTTNRWVTKSGNKYYIGSKGVVLKGSQRVNGKYYFFDLETRVMYKNKKLVRDGKIFYYGSDGVRFNGGFKTIKEDGVYNKYYFQKNGLAKKGWLRLNGKKYYFYPSGDKAGVCVRHARLRTASGMVYVFDKNGVYVRRYKSK
nr:GH25 family lysozyme [uncultured Blautia sp.]